MTTVMIFSLTAFVLGTAVQTASAAPNEAPVLQEDETVTFVDGSGEEVTVKVNPKRVAIYDISILDILHTAGFDKTGIVTLGIPKTASSLPDYLGKYRDDDQYVNVGTLFEADYDVLDLLDPDLIIGGSRFGARSGEGGEGKTVDDVKKRYPNAGYLNFDIDVYSDDELPYEDGLKRNFEILGQIFPELKPDLDAGIIELTEGIAEVREKSGDAETLFLMIGPGYVTFYGPVGRFSMAHKEFGFKPADTTTEGGSLHGAEVSAEYVKTINPKVILLFDRNASFGEAGSVDEFLANSLIQETDAYKNDNIYVLDSVAWYLNIGGFTSTRQMITDLKQYTDKLN